MVDTIATADNKGEAKDRTLGPYILSSTLITAQQLSAMSPEKKLIRQQSIESTTIHFRAIEASYIDNAIGELPIKLDGKRTALLDIIAKGKTLPDNEKMELVRKVMNQNVKYTPPEVDIFIPRRKGAPLQDEINDYAQTVRETFESGIGDCEDWAIAQADLLARMGIPPENLQIMAGTVYNTNDNTQFDHVNLGVKTSSGNWSVMELGGDNKIFIAPESYLTDGIQGFYFFPVSMIDADGNKTNAVMNNEPQPSTKTSQGFTSSSYTQNGKGKPDITSGDAFERAASGVASAAPEIPQTGNDIKIAPTTLER